MRVWKVDEVRQALSPIHQELAALGVDTLTLFGSTARNEAGPLSDLDIALAFSGPVTSDNDSQPANAVVAGLLTNLNSLMRVGKVSMMVENLLQHPVDMITWDAMAENVRAAALRDGVVVADLRRPAP